MAAFIESLKVMGLGMLGVFSVAVVLVIIMIILTKIFPGGKSRKKGEKTSEYSTEDEQK